jgi:hypothetical protein
MQYKAIQGKARQYKAIQGNTRQYKAIQGNTRQYKAKQGKARQWGDILPVIIVIFKVSNQFSYSYQDNRTNLSFISFTKVYKSMLCLYAFNILE